MSSQLRISGYGSRYEVFVIERKRIGKPTLAGKWPPAVYLPICVVPLLVVIAIIGILSALVVTQLGASQIKARNATAQSDIVEMGKAVESFRVEDSASGAVISNVPGSVDSLTGTSGTLPQVFTGTQAVNGASSTYAAAVSKTPSSAYTYRYVASGTPLAGGSTARLLVQGASGKAEYAFCSNLVSAVQPYACAADGSGTGLSGSDQVLANQGPGNAAPVASGPVPVSVSFSGTSGTLTWSVGQSPPLLQAMYPPLSITGLSGGPVTIYSVINNFGNSYFMISRAIASGETGGFLNGVAGAFTDSATPRNASAAFSMPIRP